MLTLDAVALFASSLVKLIAIKIKLILTRLMLREIILTQSFFCLFNLIDRDDLETLTTGWLDLPN